MAVRLLQPLRAPQPAELELLLVVRRARSTASRTTRSPSARSTRCRMRRAPTTTSSSTSATCPPASACSSCAAGRRPGDTLRPRRRAHPARPPPRQRHLPRRHHRVAPPRRDRAPATAATSCATSGSLNGTYVNQERIDEAAAAPRRRAAGRQVPARVLRRADGLMASDDGGARRTCRSARCSALLQEEFPDVTISKIRFLESQGLIDPERTPSGYRKFYDADVERLRLILREQRENFLPLKVIKDRLESGAIEGEGGATPPRGIRNVTVLPIAGDDSRETAVSRQHPSAQLRLAATPTLPGTPANGLELVDDQRRRRPQPRRPCRAHRRLPNRWPRCGPDERGIDGRAAGTGRGGHHGAAPAARAGDRPAPDVLGRGAVHDRRHHARAARRARVVRPGQPGAARAAPRSTPAATSSVAVAAPGSCSAASRPATCARGGRPPSARPRLFEQLILPLLRQRNPQARQQAAEHAARAVAPRRRAARGARRHGAAPPPRRLSHRGRTAGRHDAEPVRS